MKERDDNGPPPPINAAGQRYLIIEAPYYDDIAAALAEGAIAEFEASGAEYDRVVVPGALEIPQALAAAVRAGVVANGGQGKYSGVVALGCVIRGETGHYDIVCNNANHWLMEIATQNCVPLGNAILTVDSHEQAIVRASGGRSGKGADAARAAMRIAQMADEFDQDAPTGISV